jgi:hypothetical protein
VGDGEGGEDVRCYLESLRLEESPILFCMYRLKCFQVNQLHSLSWYFAIYLSRLLSPYYCKK